LRFDHHGENMMASSKKVSHKDLNDPRHNERHGIFLIIIMAILGLMTIFVETMLVPGLPGIARDLSAQTTDLAWVLAAYSLAGAVTIPIVGKLGEMYGRKPLLLAIMVVYMIGLTGAAVSWDLLSLIVFRTIQGIGMGAVTLLMGMAMDILPPRLVPVGIGLIGAMLGVGAATGMVGGGILISFIGWKEAFWVVLPIVALLSVIVWRIVPDKQARHPTRMDVIGSILLGFGILTFLLPLSQGAVWGWRSSLTVGLFVCAALFFVAFIVREKRCSEPIVRLELLKNRNITVAYISMFFIGLAMFMLYQTLPFFMGEPVENGGFGKTSQVIIGLFLLPNAVGQLIASPLGGKLGLRFGHWRILTAGLVIAALGFISLALLRTSEVGVILSVLMFGVGIGMASTGNTNTISCVCSKDNFGSTTAVNSMILTIGMSVGPVLAALILGSFVGDMSGYIYCWGIAALLSLLTALFVWSNKSALSAGTISSAPHEAQTLGGQ